MDTKPFRFNLSEHYQVFHFFPNLPAEIRRQIWTMAVPCHGRLHFSIIEGRTNPFRLEEQAHFAVTDPEENLSNGPVLRDVERIVRYEPERLCVDFGRLRLHHPGVRGTNRDTINALYSLRRACFESREVALELANKPGVQRTYGGLPLTLDGSTDVVGIEYANLPMFSSSCYLEITCLRPHMFENLRRVAFPYCWAWEERHWVHTIDDEGKIDIASMVNFPVHMYQFLARHMPALEDVFLIDYSIKRGSPCRPPGLLYPGPDETDLEVPEAFSNGNLRYHQVVYGTNWEISSQVMELRQWLRTRFVYYAKRGRHVKHRNPEKVRFHVLACEATIAPTVKPPKAAHKVNALDKAKAKRRDERRDRYIRRQDDQHMLMRAHGYVLDQVRAIYQMMGQFEGLDIDHDTLHGHPFTFTS